MKITYFHFPKDVPVFQKLETAVVIDVLRATTTITWALKNGAESIQTFSDIKLLQEKASFLEPDSRLLLGERGGKKINGYVSRGEVKNSLS